MPVANKQILINATLGEIRVAVVKDGILQTLEIERENQKGLLGNIYKGKVVRVVPGMQAAFVDVGLAKNAFLHVRDIVSDGGETGSLPIEKLLHQGQFLLGQIIKDEVADKGARLSTEIGLTSTNLVYLPNRNDIGLSHKIEEPECRSDLFKSIQIARQELSIPGGFIARTQAQFTTPDDIKSDMQFLHTLWQKVQQLSQQSQTPQLLHLEMPLVFRALREFADLSTEAIKVDSQEWFDKAQSFAREFMPQLSNSLEFHAELSPLFDHEDVEEQINAALETTVALGCGGNMVIEQTEAMTTIDINSGSFIGHKRGVSNDEQLALTTNLDAAVNIAHQLRLRNLGGMIIVDFIDMPTTRQRQQVLEMLRSSLSRDLVKSSVSDFSALGLVEITRQRQTDSLRDMICQPCSTCSGRGYVKTAQSMCYEILRELMRQTERFLAPVYTIVATSEIVDLLNGGMRPNLEKLQKKIDRPIRLQVVSANSTHTFEIIGS